MLDVVIIGAGPAGLTAAIYAGRAGLKSLVIEGGGVGGQILSTYEIDNYPAVPGVSGMELGNMMKEHALKLGANIVNDTVTKLECNGDIKRVIAGENIYETRNILIATGARHALLGVEREEELTGMGVSYCATCDGAFYKGADVCVVGGGDVAAEDAIFLARECGKVYLIHRRDSFRAAESLMKKVRDTENIQIITDSVVTELIGDDELNAVRVKNVKSGEVQDIDVEGLFVAVGINPVTDLLKGIVNMDEKGYIIAGEDCQTSVSGVYVAGDARKKALRQVVTAVADGANAINSMIV